MQTDPQSLTLPAFASAADALAELLPGDGPLDLSQPGVLRRGERSIALRLDVEPGEAGAAESILSLATLAIAGSESLAAARRRVAGDGDGGDDGEVSIPGFVMCLESLVEEIRIMSDELAAEGYPPVLGLAVAARALEQAGEALAGFDGGAA